MIMEHAILNVRQGETTRFEDAFRKAESLIALTPGYLGHELHQCIEKANQYLLIVRWRKLEDHLVGFRKGPHYPAWRKLLHGFYEPFPTVEHYERLGGHLCLSD